MMFPTAATLCLLLLTSCYGLENVSLEKRALLDGQLECSRMVLSHLTNNDGSCINVASSVIDLLPQEDIVSELQSLNDAIFVELCLPSCGGHILTAWRTCNVTLNYEREVQLVNGLCGRDRGKECYESTEEIFNFIEDVEGCQAGDECLQECRDLIDDGDDNYGCCINVPIDFRTAGGESDLVAVIDSTFEKCSEDREDKDECDRLGIISQGLSVLVDLNPSLSPEQIVCVTDTLATDDDLQPECVTAAHKLIVQFNSDSLTSSLLEDQSALSVFCDPSCGPAIMESLMTCNAYEDIKAEADLITDLCGLNNGVPCYSQYNELMENIDDGIYCGERGDGIVCPPLCAAYYQMTADDFGCCFNVFINYLDAVITDGSDDRTISDVVDTFYEVCEVERPDRCTASALTSMNTEQPTAMETMITPRCVNAAASYGPVLSLLVVAMMIAILVL